MAGVAMLWPIWTRQPFAANALMTSQPPGISGATVAITILNRLAQLVARTASPSSIRETSMAPGLSGFTNGPSRCAPNTTASPGRLAAAIDVMAASDFSMTGTGPVAVVGAITVVP